MAYNSDLLKEIWKKHVEVQECVLQKNSAPIEIDSEATSITKGKVFLSINESNQLDICLSKLKHFFDITDEDIKLNQGYLFCASDFTCDRTIMSRLVESLAKDYVTLSNNPVIEGIINSKKSAFVQIANYLKTHGVDYSIDRSKRLQLSVESLRDMEDDPTISNEILPDRATAIFPIKPTPAYFLRKWLPSIECTHVVKQEKLRLGGGEKKIIFKNNIILHDKYFNDKVLSILKELWGMRLVTMKAKFVVEQTALEHYDFENSVYDFEKNGDGAFVYDFKLNVNGDENASNEILKKQWQIDLLKDIFNAEFGKDRVSLSVDYLYAYDNKIFYSDYLENIDYSSFYEELKSYQLPDYLSISERAKSLGVDFDWRENDVRKLKIEISNKIDILDISTFADHRCNIEISNKFADWEKIEEFLRENFLSLQIFYSEQDGSLHFAQEYSKSEQASQFEYSLQNSFETLESWGCDCKILKNPVGKKRYLCHFDEQKNAENLEAAIATLRGAEFTCHSKPFGKLIKVNFPDLIFDTSSYDQEEVSLLLKNAFSITPNLDGDIEKIARLKNAFDRIVSGKDVKNNKLNEFIFDSSKAEATLDIDELIDEDSEFYEDIKENLLNKYINKPQMEAIIKCLNAKDISLIQGPPGTGKSTAIAELIWQHIRLNPEERILLTSETNLAVDNAMDRTVNGIHNLVKPIRFGSDDRLAEEGKQFSLTTMEEWVETGEYKTQLEEDVDISDENFEIRTKDSDRLILINWLQNINNRIDRSLMPNKAAELWSKMLLSPNKALRQLIFDKYKANCNVIGATCSSIAEKNTKGRATKFFMSYCSIFGKVEQFTYYDKSATDDSEPRTGYKYISKDGITFTTVIQDESSKATPAELALPLIYGKKNIIIGDHRQLPPMLDKEEFVNTFNFLESNANSISEKKQLSSLKKYILRHFNEMEISHFQRIYENLDESLKGEFTLQYRMHPDINAVIEQFYQDDKGLTCGLKELGVDNVDMSSPFSRYHGIEIDDFISHESLNPENHVIWIDVNTPEMIEGTSRVNEGEVKVIEQILRKFSESDSFNEYLDFWKNDEDKEVGIISFYSKQRNRIRAMSKKITDIPMKIDVVDRFQGMERNIIIVSMVRSNCITTDSCQSPDNNLYGPLGFPEQKDLGFAQSPNRLNVALSRAKRLLIIVGNSQLFRQKDIYDNVYNIIANNPSGKIIKCNPYEHID